MTHEALPAFAGWAGPRNAKIVFVGEAFGREEDQSRQPFTGAAGKELWRMLGEAWPDEHPELHRQIMQLHNFGNSWINSRSDWLHASSTAFTNVFNFRPPDNQIPSICSPRGQVSDESAAFGPLAGAGKYLQSKYLSEIERLFEELEVCRPNLVVALGGTACWALLRTTGIGSIRGTTTLAKVENISKQREAAKDQMKVLPTFHPASVLYQWSQRPIVVADLMKARREGQFPEIRRPNRTVITSPTIDEWRDWILQTLRGRPPLLSCDTETSLGQIDTIGFSTSHDNAIVCQVGPHRIRRGTGYYTIWPLRDGQKVTSYFSRQEEFQFWSLNKQLLESDIPKIGQNFIYDLQYLMRIGIRPRNVLHDTMLHHHSLFPELNKGLGFLGSIYTDEPAWKLMRRGAADTEKRDE